METLLKYSDPDKDATQLFIEKLHCHPVLARLLSARNILTLSDATAFLHPNLENLTDPFLFKDMETAVKRIATAIENSEKILVFGDFDADGVTATALLVDFLERCQANTSWYIPHRIKEGYGFQPGHIQMARDLDVDLIITVDCGVTSLDAVQGALAEDIDVIVTDHHEPGPELPSALAVINPKQKGCASGLSYLAGVGVAFFLVMAIRKHLREKGFFQTLCEPNLMDCLDLFTIGTIGDMVPLIHINRTLCVAGFKRIRQGARPGLKSLADISRLDLSKIDSDDISFKIVPRINAAGRVSHARICVSQLTATDRISAEKNAEILDQLNIKRRRIEQEIITDIEKKLARNPDLINKKLLFLWDDKWDTSVLGIAASKLAKKYFCPVVLLSTANGDAVGSCRSINQINIHQALFECEHLLVRYGGHAMASGLTVKKDKLIPLKQSLLSHIETSYSRHDFQKTITIDAILDPKDIDIHLAKEIDRLRPFGTENPEPIFLCKDLHVSSSFVIGNCHRKMTLERYGNSHQPVEAFHFNVSDPENLPDYYPKLAFKIKINKFKTNTVQIIIEDL